MVGLLNATAFGSDWERFKTYVEPRPTAVVIEDYLVATGPGESIQLAQPDGVRRRRCSAEEGGEEKREGEGGHSTGCGFETPEPGTVCFFPSVDHAEPQLSKILLSVGIVAGAYAIAIAFCVVVLRHAGTSGWWG